MSVEEEIDFSCPYCMAPNSLLLDKTAGRRQSFTVDCETCCQAITMTVEIYPDGEAQATVKQENE